MRTTYETPAYREEGDGDRLRAMAPDSIGNDVADELERLQALVREALSEYSIGYVLGTDWVERAQAAIADA